MHLLPLLSRINTTLKQQGVHYNVIKPSYVGHMENLPRLITRVQRLLCVELACLLACLRCLPRSLACFDIHPVACYYVLARLLARLLASAIRQPYDFVRLLFFSVLCCAVLRRTSSCIKQARAVQCSQCRTSRRCIYLVVVGAVAGSLRAPLRASLRLQPTAANCQADSERG